MPDLKVNLDKLFGETNSGADSRVDDTMSKLQNNADPLVSFEKPEKKVDITVTDSESTDKKVETNDPLKGKPIVEDKKVETTEDATDDEVTVLSQILEESGLEFDEEEKKGLENNIPGILKASKLVATKLAERQLDDFFDEYPEVYDYAVHIKSGGKPEDFNPSASASYGKVTIEEGNTAQHSDIYTKSLLKKGVPAGDAKDLVELAESKGVLKEKAIGALADIQALELADSQRREKTIADKNASDKAKQIELKTNIESIINSGKINGIDIGTAEQNQLKDFYNKVDKDGKTSRAKAWENLTLEQRVLLDRIIMSGFKGLGTQPISKKQELDALGNLNGDRKTRINSGGKSGVTTVKDQPKITQSDLNKLLKDNVN